MLERERGLIVLDFMRLCGLHVGDSVLKSSIMTYGLEQGFEIGYMEDAVVYACIKGWVCAIDHQIYLSEKGYLTLLPANDN